MDGSAASKRRKLKRDTPSAEAGSDYPLVSPSPPQIGISSQSHDATRERGDRKGALMQRGAYMEDPVPRLHAKEAASKIGRRDNDQYEHTLEPALFYFLLTSYLGVS